MYFSEKLTELEAEVYNKLQELIGEHGEKSEFVSSWPVLKLKDGEHDDLMYNFTQGGRYLKEIAQNCLIDNRGYQYSYHAIDFETLVIVTDYFCMEFEE